MKNILLALNAAKPEMNAIDFACYIANLSHSKLTGVFLENVREPRIPELRTFHGLPFVETIKESSGGYGRFWPEPFFGSAQTQCFQIGG